MGGKKWFHSVWCVVLMPGHACVYVGGTDERYIGCHALSPAQVQQQCHHKPVPEHLPHTTDGRQPSRKTCMFT